MRVKRPPCPTTAIVDSGRERICCSSSAMRSYSPNSKCGVHQTSGFIVSNPSISFISGIVIASCAFGRPSSQGAPIRSRSSGQTTHFGLSVGSRFWNAGPCPNAPWAVWKARVSGETSTTSTSLSGPLVPPSRSCRSLACPRPVVLSGGSTRFQPGRLALWSPCPCRMKSTVFDDDEICLGSFVRTGGFDFLLRQHPRSFQTKPTM
mmetsp:Transcript_8168/g.25536  ORF Transcript_8168/g.25536 Transcript_8168/m.25536 type:complete len:206 (+) Transcript_8168:304-921(+)